MQVSALCFVSFWFREGENPGDSSHHESFRLLDGESGGEEVYHSPEISVSCIYLKSHLVLEIPFSMLYQSFLMFIFLQYMWILDLARFLHYIQDLIRCLGFFYLGRLSSIERKDHSYNFRFHESLHWFRVRGMWVVSWVFLWLWLSSTTTWEGSVTPPFCYIRDHHHLHTPPHTSIIDRECWVRVWYSWLVVFWEHLGNTHKYVYFPFQHLEISEISLYDQYREKKVLF